MGQIDDSNALHNINCSICHGSMLDPNLKFTL